MSDLIFKINHKSLPDMYKQVEIFTDGSCINNPGPGGYGVIVRYKKVEKIFTMGYQLTTNNRMELMAAIVALEVLTAPCNVILSTDSQYVQQGITRWIFNWKKQGWKSAKRQLIKNIDLWQRLELAVQRHIITWEWVKSHAGHIDNERCDMLARDATGSPTEKDIGYQLEI